MPALVRADGRLKCNARCYDAKKVQEYCKCPCGGSNHGVGLAQAQLNTEARKGDWTLVFPPPVHVEADEQGELFECV